MSNQCNNSIEITTKAPLDKFLAQDKEWQRTLHFGKLIPIAEEDRNISKAHQTRGTKRDIYGPQKDKCDRPLDVAQNKNWVRYIYGSFDTARAPPIEYYKELFEVIKQHDARSTIKAYYIEMWVWFLWSRIKRWQHRDEYQRHPWDRRARLPSYHRRLRQAYHLGHTQRTFGHTWRDRRDTQRVYTRTGNDRST